MNDLSTRVRNYLNRKRGVTPEITRTEVEQVDPEVQAILDTWNNLCDTFGTAWKIMKWAALILAAITFMWTLAIADIQADCYKHKECREWMK